MSQGHQGITKMSSEDPLSSPLWVQQMNLFGGAKIPFLFILDFKLQEPLVIALQDLFSAGIQYQIKGIPEYISPSQDFHLEKKSVDFEIYRQGFEEAMKGILAGDTYLLNLTYSTQLFGIDDLEKIFLASKAPYKLYFHHKFVCFSPECFVTITDGVIRTFPMKGTIDDSIPDAENILLADRKEQEEHATVVDLLRNDLSIVAERVTVERYRYITRINTAGKTLLQCSSEISGKLPEDYQAHLGDIFHAILPAGSVTGAPKKKTVELIEAIEPERRGYYTGVFGVYDGHNVDSAVMIRMIEQRGDEFYYRSGGGITYRSDVESEYQEMMDKVYIPK